MQSDDRPRASVVKGNLGEQHGTNPVILRLSGWAEKGVTSRNEMGHQGRVRQTKARGEESGVILNPVWYFISLCALSLHVFLYGLCPCASIAMYHHQISMIRVLYTGLDV